MKTAWQVRRTPVPYEDGERRWDYAYQFLLQWAVNPEASEQSASAQQQEDSHGSRSVRSRFNLSATPTPDD